MPWGCWLLCVVLACLAQLCPWLVQGWVTTSLPHDGAQLGAVELVRVQG